MNSVRSDGGRKLSAQICFWLTYGRDSNLFIILTGQNQNLLSGLTQRDQAIQLNLTYRLYR